MKFLKLNRLERVSDQLLTTSCVFVNKDLIRYFEEVRPNSDEPPLTRIILLGNEKMDVMESPSQIESMCASIQGVEIVRHKKVS